MALDLPPIKLKRKIDDPKALRRDIRLLINSENSKEKDECILWWKISFLLQDAGKKHAKDFLERHKGEYWEWV